MRTRPASATKNDHREERVQRLDGGFVDYAWLNLSVTDLPRLAHESLHAAYSFDDISLLQGFYGSFWLGAPESRSVLFILPSVQRGPFQSKYSHGGVTWEGIQYISIDEGEIACLYSERESGLRMIRGELRDGDGRPLRGVAARVAEVLAEERRLLFFPAGHQDMRRNVPAPDSVDLIVPVSRTAGRLSTASKDGIAFNSGYFVWTDEEFSQDPSARVPDPVGMLVEDGIIMHPPIYHRPTFEIYEGTTPQARIADYSMADIDVLIAGSTYPGSSACTRECPTCASDENLVAIVGRQVVGLVERRGRPTPPGGGFLMAVDPDTMASILGGATDVTYKLRERAIPRTAAQGAIRIISRGVPLDLTVEAAGVTLTTTPAVVGGIPPNHLTASVLLSDKRAQTAVGIRADGSLVVCVVSSTEPRSADLR